MDFYSGVYESPVTLLSRAPGLGSQAGCSEVPVACGPRGAGQVWAVEGNSSPWPCSSFRNDSGPIHINSQWLQTSRSSRMSFQNPTYQRPLMDVTTKGAAFATESTLAAPGAPKVE